MSIYQRTNFFIIIWILSLINLSLPLSISAQEKQLVDTDRLEVKKPVTDDFKKEQMPSVKPAKQVQEKIEPTIKQKLLGSTLALVPGLILSGGGHWYIDRQKEASRLYWWKLTGLVGLLTGGALLASSGASELMTPWVTPILLVSSSSFILPTALDLIGVWSKAKERRTPALDQAPLLEAQGQFKISLGSGLLLDQDPEVESAYYEFTLGQQIHHFAYQLKGTMHDAQSRFNLEIEQQFTQGEGWSVWGRGGGTAHLMPQTKLHLYQGEASLRTYLRLGQFIGTSRLSAFTADIAFGWTGGMLIYSKNSADQLTGILGGFTFRHHSFKDRLRVALAYEHRHDDWIGGAILPGLGSGILGYLSLKMSARLLSQWWIETQSSFGSVHLHLLKLNWTP